MFKIVDNLSSLPEMFFSCVGLYFGRRVNLTGKTATVDLSDKAQ